MNMLVVVIYCIFKARCSSPSSSSMPIRPKENKNARTKWEVDNYFVEKKKLTAFILEATSPT